ncbi:MAG: hypothetical protein ACRCSQ_09140 [Bacteroidales bacterium]
MKKIYFMTMLIPIIGLGYSHTPDSKSRSNEREILTDSLELELVMLTNQAFCDCYYKSTKNVGAHISPPDGSNYIQLSGLVAQYANDPGLNKIVDRWVQKEYHSYSEENKLYLMRCLDFYNSTDLKAYIDSVREVKKNELLIEFDKEQM